MGKNKGHALNDKIQMTKSEILTILLCCVCVLIISPSAFAHKVSIFAYVEGDTVYTESYFPDGKKVEGGIIEVYDSQDKKLLEGITNDKGQFNFKPTKREDLRIIINASMGHRSSYILSADELPDNIEAQTQEVQDASRKITQVDIEQIKSVVEGSIDQKLKPIMRKLTKLEQKKISFIEVIGGIGYIFGIAGVVLYFLSKSRSKG